jgi:hypothetical protein
MRLSRSALDAIDLSELALLSSDRNAFLGEREHYRLLAYLSTQGAGPVVDVGTHLGDSALALTYGCDHVSTFDVVDKGASRVPVTVADLFDGEVRSRYHSQLLGAGLILIDVDPHEGTRELSLVRWLLENSYDGLIVLDDIWYFKPMRDNCWSQIPDRLKVDVTSLGHWSGTGIVARDPSRLPIVEEPMGGLYPHCNDNWTLVTGYFDLTGKADATPDLRSRTREHYLDVHGRATLAMPNNLVVYCDPELEERVWGLRPSHLHKMTEVVPADFEALPLTHYRTDIVRNRAGHGRCSRDPRNTASYYLFCMARYAMLKDAIGRGHFASSHYAWVNICIERMGWRNVALMQRALVEDRNGFSTCWIDYVSEEKARNWPGYFGGGGCQNCAAGCTMCSGFFTGAARVMWEVCTRMEEKFLACLRAGYGHADEQLMPLVYYDEPELFDWYIGDYAEMVTNYALVRERPEQPLRQLIAHALEAGDKTVARRACAILRKSVEAGACSVGEELARAEEACR